MNGVRGARRLLVCLCVFSGTLWAAPKYAGSAACKSCHPDYFTTFYRNPHYKSLSSGKELPEDSGCESCHGPGSDHIAAGGGKRGIITFGKLAAHEVVKSCLRCHSESLGRMQVQRSSHTQAQVACNSCHSIHKFRTQRGMLAKGQRDLCYGCHPSVRAQFSLPSKHRVNEGFMACADCHNPHGSPAPTWRMGARPRLVETALANEAPCLKCHIDKRGPFAFEHAALRVDGCESCHAPHGSAHTRLLRRPVVFTLCLECHNGLSEFGRQGDGVALTSATHSMNDPKYQNCTGCHVRIHGSNADARFLR